jgi:hypothetical protein
MTLLETTNVRKLAAAFLFVAGALTMAPAGQAQAAGPQERNVNVAFRYDPGAPAQTIYADLNRVARNACEHAGQRSLRMRQLESDCTAAVVNSAIQEIGRRDVAALHQTRAG